MSVKIYVARAMSGRIKEEVVKEAKRDKAFLEKCGFIVLDPVTAEGVKASKQVLQATKVQMDTFWKRDKEMIRQANVVFIMSPDKASLGCIREYGYARYHLWKKTITIFPEGKLPPEGAVAYYEDDYVTDSLIDAIGETLRTHGTVLKRLKWRVALYQRCWLKAMKHRIQEWVK